MACDAGTLITLAQATDGYGRLSKRDVLLGLAAVYCVTGKGWNAATAMGQAKDYHRLSLREMFMALLSVLCGGAPAQAAPTNGQWSAFQGIDPTTLGAVINNPDSAPCPSWNLRYRDQSSLVWIEAGATLVINEISVGTFTPGHVAQAQARWEGCASGTSDWSATQTVTF